MKNIDYLLKKIHLTSELNEIYRKKSKGKY